MLAALLCNIPQFSQHGEAAKPRSYSTSWNPRWSEMYGPDAEAKKRDEKLIKAAEKVIKEAEYVPPALEELKEVVHKRSLVNELNDYQPDTDFYLVYLLEAYFYFCDWRKKDDEAIATALLIME